MPKKAVIIIVAICFGLAVVGVGVVGWLWFTRDRVAVASFRVKLVEEGQTVSGILKKEESVMKSDEVLKPIIGKFDLVAHWELGGEEEALDHLRSKLTIKAGGLSDEVKIVFRDRDQEFAKDVLESINFNFLLERRKRAQKLGLPDMLPREGEPEPGSSPAGTPAPAGS